LDEVELLHELVLRTNLKELPIEPGLPIGDDRFEDVQIPCAGLDPNPLPKSGLTHS